MGLLTSVCKYIPMLHVLHRRHFLPARVAQQSLSSACARTQGQVERTARAAVGPWGARRTDGSGGSACGGGVLFNNRDCYPRNSLMKSAVLVVCVNHWNGGVCVNLWNRSELADALMSSTTWLLTWCVECLDSYLECMMPVICSSCKELWTYTPLLS